MTDEKYFDLLIIDDDLALDAGGQPERCWDRDSIAQDIAHMIRETGLLVELVANRDTKIEQRNLVKITLHVDEDERIIPGTAEIIKAEMGKYYLLADTVDYGPLNFELEAI